MASYGIRVLSLGGPALSLHDVDVLPHDELANMLDRLHVVFTNQFAFVAIATLLPVCHLKKKRLVTFQRFHVRMGIP